MSSSSSAIDWNDVIKKEARGSNDEDLGEVQEVGDSYVLVQLKDKVKSIGKKTEEKTKELKDKSMQKMHIGPVNDAHDIQALGTTTCQIENEPDYEMQEKEQMDVIDSRLEMVKRIR